MACTPLMSENRERFMGAQRAAKRSHRGGLTLTWSSFAFTSRVRTAYM